jgi:hypothetical protein
MIPKADDNLPIDIRIVEAPVPLRLENPVASDTRWDAGQGRFLLRGGRKAGRFLVESGDLVKLERNAGCEDKILEAYLITTLIVELLRQRGMLVLHANTLMTDKGAIALSGVSGAGKSTTLASLISRGCQMVSDDVTVLSLDSHGTIVALPGIPKLNLCEDAALHMGHDIAKLPKNPLRQIKVIAPLQGKIADAPVPLYAICILDKHTDADLSVKKLTGTDKFSALQKCIYGPMLPDVHQEQFKLFTAISSRIEFFRITRPEAGWSLDQVVEAVLNV